MSTGTDLEWATSLCMESASTCPEELLERLMADERCVSFGPIHHFLVGAALLTCYRNDEAADDRDGRLATDLSTLAERSACVPGAACARWGVCGAAASAGMAHAIIRDNAPLKVEGWQDGQHMVAHILDHIATAGAPRCCKRDSRIAVRDATDAFNELLGCHLAHAGSAPVCSSMRDNSACMGGACPYNPSRR